MIPAKNPPDKKGRDRGARRPRSEVDLIERIAIDDVGLGQPGKMRERVRRRVASNRVRFPIDKQAILDWSRVGIPIDPDEANRAGLR